MSASGSASPSQEWSDKYKVDTSNVSGSGAGKLTYFDFGDVKEIPAADWSAAQEVERRQRAARPAALLAAEKALYHSIKNMPQIALRDGTKLPAIGLGTWKAERGQVRAAVHVALKAGYRHIDCATVYKNEDEVGDELHHVLSKGLIDRSELYVCSKVWNDDHAADRVRASCLRSLKALKLEYLDLYLIHWPVTGNVGDVVKPSLKETWQALEGLVKEGLVRSIGTSNFSAKKQAEIMEYAEILPAVCQVEVHPYHRNDALIAWCKQHDIHVTAYAPLGSPDSESIFPRKFPDVLLQDPIVKEVAQRTGKNVGQVLLRWALQHGTSVIPKSINPDRIKGNLDVLDWELSAENYNKISTLKFQQRMINGALWLNPRGPYPTMQDLWDEEIGEDENDEGGEKAQVPLPPVQPQQQQQQEKESKPKLDSSSSTAQKGKNSTNSGWGGKLSSWLHTKN